MANDLIPWGDGMQLPDFYTEFDEPDLDNLGLGISTSFAVLSFKGKEWRVKYSGDEHLLRDDKGDGLRRLNVIVVGVSPAVSKTYYAGAYVPGSADAPDCASIDGIRPDAGVPDPQNDLCATCPNNVFGSRVTEMGGKAKACADHKRLAVVPSNDIRNEQFGGPMLLRIPPASLQNLVTYMGILKQHRCPPFGCITEISFEPSVEYPNLILKPIRAIANRDVLDVIMEVKRSFITDTVLGVNALSLADQRHAPQAQPKVTTVQQPARKAPYVPEPVEEAEEVQEQDEPTVSVSAKPDVKAPPVTQPTRGRGRPPKAAANGNAPAAQTLSASDEDALPSLLGNLLGGLN